MSENHHQEYFITGVLKLDTALHIGTGKDSEPTDSPLRRTGDGRYFIPGRALGGSLRTLATRLAPRLKGYKVCTTLGDPKADKDAVPDEEKKPCGCEVCQLFGDVNPVDGSNASRLWVYDAYTSNPTPTHVRDGVGIKRQTGTAGHNVKYDYEIIPAGTTFDFRLRVAFEPKPEEKDLQKLNIWLKPEERQKAMAFLAATLAEWEQGRGQLGGGTARGLGRFHFDETPAYTETAVTDADSLITYLLSDEARQVSEPVDSWPADLIKAARSDLTERAKSGRKMSVAGPFLSVDFSLRFTDLYLSNDPLAALVAGFDHVSLVNFIAKNGLQRPVLSGAGLRGVFRSHAEKIARTLATDYFLDDPSEDKVNDDFLSRCPACDVSAGEKESLGSCDSRLKILDTAETPEKALCLSCRLFGSQRRGSRLWIGDGHWADLEAIEAYGWLAQDFLAVDRFTGGGLDKAKFDAAPLLGAKFKLSLLLHDPQRWELGWLALVLRDLADGRLTAGFGAAKGYGRVSGSDFTWRVGWLDKTDKKHFPDQLAPAAESGLYDLSENTAAGWLPTGWDDAAKGWVEAFNDKVKGYKTHSELKKMETDTFFTVQDKVDFLELYGRSRVEVEAG